MDSYQYQPIDPATDAIRVPRLLGGYKIEPIECHLIESLFGQEQRKHFLPSPFLQSAPGALRPAVSQPITLCGKKKSVSEKLVLDPVHPRIEASLS